MPVFKKDFSIFNTKKKTLPPHPSLQQSSQPSPPPQLQLPVPSAVQRGIVHHSSLLLLQRNGMAQEPKGLWDDKEIYETPPRRAPGQRPFFDPESPARRFESRQIRATIARREAREARINDEAYLQGPAHRVAVSQEDIEDVCCQLREAGRWENMHLDMRERRREMSRSSWFGKETGDERKCRLTAERAMKSVVGPDWTKEYEPQTPAQLESSAASIRSKRRMSNSSNYTYTSVSNKDSYRNSILSTTTTQSTPRSSIMSTNQQSNVSSPISSGMPSPAFSIASGKDAFGKPTLPIEKAAPLRLPPAAVCP